MTNLYYAGTLPCGTIRLQSQLILGKMAADYIIRTDGILRNLGRGNKGFDFYPIDIEYRIIYPQLTK